MRRTVFVFLCVLGLGCEPATVNQGTLHYPLERYRVQQDFANPNPLFGGLYHSAEDARGDAGTPVLAIADGTVSFSGVIDGYGWTLIVDHPRDDVYSLYGHVSTRRYKVVSGAVERGEVIATLADDDEDGSGGAYPDWKPHLHFGLRRGSRADYPDSGDGRWMAGYTAAHPSSLGWLEPSTYIAEH